MFCCLVNISMAYRFPGEEVLTNLWFEVCEMLLHFLQCSQECQPFFKAVQKFEASLQTPLDPNVIDLHQVLAVVESSPTGQMPSNVGGLNKLMCSCLCHVLCTYWLVDVLHSIASPASPSCNPQYSWMISINVSPNHKVSQVSLAPMLLPKFPCTRPGQWLTGSPICRQEGLLSMCWWNFTPGMIHNLCCECPLHETTSLFSPNYSRIFLTSIFSWRIAKYCSISK